MADISQYTDGSTTYDFKDTTGRSLIAAETATRKSQVTALSNALEKGVGRQIRVLNSAAQGILYNEEVDSDEGYTKDVPDGVLSLAAVNTVGGKSLVWNQLVSSSASSVTVASSHIYIAKISGTWSRATSSGSALSVTGGTDMIFDITAMFGSGNEPSTVAEFRAMFPADYYSYSENTLLNADVTNVKSEGKNLWQMSESLISSKYSGTTVSFSGNSITCTTSNAWAGDYVYFGDVEVSGTHVFSWLSETPDKVASGAYMVSPLIKAYDASGTEITDRALVFSNMYYWQNYNSHYKGFAYSRYGGVVYNDGATRNTRIAEFLPAVAKIKIGLTFSSATTGETLIGSNIQLERGSTATSYIPYEGTVGNLAIPSAARALCPNYGASAGDVYNYIDWDNRVYHQLVGSRSYQSGDESDTSVVTDGTTTYYALSEDVTVDLSSVLTADNFVQVSGGILTLENSHGDTYRIPVPNTETFEIDVNEAL